jgi:uncharacterized protein
MRNLTILLSVLFLFIVVSCSRTYKPYNSDLHIMGANPRFDKELAARLGADEYGMSHYVMALLKAGPNRDQDTSTAADLQKAHLKNIRRMAEEGKLMLAGPFMDEGDWRGIYVFDTASIEEARQWTETDPAVRAGRLVMELHPWYGPAALKKVNQIQKAVQRKAF